MTTYTISNLEPVEGLDDVTGYCVVRIEGDDLVFEAKIMLRCDLTDPLAIKGEVETFVTGKLEQYFEPPEVLAPAIEAILDTPIEI